MSWGGGEGGRSNSTAGGAFALHAVDLTSIPVITYGLLRLPGEVSELRARQNP